MKKKGLEYRHLSCRATKKASTTEISRGRKRRIEYCAACGFVYTV